MQAVLTLLVVEHHSGGGGRRVELTIPSNWNGEIMQLCKRFIDSGESSGIKIFAMFRFYVELWSPDQSMPSPFLGSV